MRLLDLDLAAPAEVLEAFRDSGRRYGRFLRAFCPYCNPTGHKRKRDLAAGIVKGRPWWGCHKCRAQDGHNAERRKQRRVAYDPASIAAEERRRTEKALKILEICRPIQAGDAVDTYLRRRGLRPYAATWPSSLGIARLVHPSQARDGRARKHPCMVARVVDAQGMPVACHRTYLTDDGHKARFDEVKLSLGPLSGAAVRLGVESPQIIIAEGIETALAAMVFAARIGVATLSTSGMKNFVLPAFVDDVIIAADRDPLDRNGRRPGLDAANALARRIASEQSKRRSLIKIRVVYPPDGYKDFADVPL